MSKAGWAVAAAILVLEDAAMHYRTLGTRVWQTGISGLRRRGGRTIDQTLGQEMRAHPDLFYGHGNGYYQTNGDVEAIANTEVRDCVYILIADILKRHAELVRNILAMRNPRPELYEELTRLQSQIDRITKIRRRAAELAVAAST